MNELNKQTLKVVNILRKLYPERAKTNPKVDKEWKRNLRVAKGKNEIETVKLLLSTLDAIPMVMKKLAHEAMIDNRPCEDRMQALKNLKDAIQAYTEIGIKDEDVEDQIKTFLNVIKNGTDEEFDTHAVEIRQMGDLARISSVGAEFKEYVKATTEFIDSLNSRV